METIIVGDGHSHQIGKILKKIKGEINMEDSPKVEEEKKLVDLKPQTVQTFFEEWVAGVLKLGQRPFWPSAFKGPYISDKNQKAIDNRARLVSRKVADIKEKVIERHGKLVRTLHNRKTGETIPTKGMSAKTLTALEASNKVARRQSLYFGEDNALDAITAVMGMPRKIRRSLARHLGMKWVGTDSYTEAEAMIKEL